jgi:hypothetical protein
LPATVLLRMTREKPLQAPPASTEAIFPLIVLPPEINIASLSGLAMSAPI